MKVTKQTEGSILIKGMTFTKGVDVEVSDAIGKYIKSTFGDAFKYEEKQKVVSKRRVAKEDK